MGGARAFGVAALALAALTLSAPAAAEVTRSSDSGFVSRHEVVVEASPKEVWLALISPAQWWTSDHTWSGDAANLTLTPQAGGCFCETIPAVDEPERFTLQGSVEHMRVIQAYPEQALRMTGALGPLQSEPVVGVLTIAISEVEQGTRIVWEYNVGGAMRYEIPMISKAVDGVMGIQLKSLAKTLGPVDVTPVADTAKPDAEPAPEAEKKDVVPASAPAPQAKPAAPPAPKVAPKPEVKPASVEAEKPAAPAAAKPAPKPAPKPGSVEDAFADLDKAPRF
jgi:outer membrane biosynthesis protein TonB